ncbi:MAG: hypothetical protein BWY87_01393 [Deltaproteobacteria bacterium ADurb.Bin510]|nr:MAG: hypothetical protein BWY87_01393 [Deltaproteobacteria bacterium ADurb.Bin510]
MRGKYESPPISVTVGSMPCETGIRPEVIRPTPPLARSLKYSIILFDGRPLSSAMLMLPIGPITIRFLTVTPLIWIGLKSCS